MDELPGLGAAGQPSAAEYVPATTDLAKLREAAGGCRGCHLYRDATQTVFGAGPATARVVMVGEQPGDVEDRRGLPFVGPAGKVLDRALEEAGIDRSLVYVTNSVKHFKFKPAASGKRRIHATPERLEITACRPWLIAEFAAIRPTGVAVLGATAAKALFGPSFLSRLVTQMYFPGDPLIPFDTIFNTAPERARHSMVASLDRAATRSEWAVAYRFDIVLRGQRRSLGT